jgi:hypothetical protein
LFRLFAGAEIDFGDAEIEVRHDLLPRFPLHFDKGGAQGLMPSYE